MIETLGRAGFTLAEALGEENDLAAVQRAIVREKAIRNAMTKTGEGRETVTEMINAMQAMDQEAVLDLAEGQPTTLIDALARYVRILLTWDQVIPRDRVAADLSAILEYPWRDEEAVLALHDPNQSLILHITHPDEETIRVAIGDNRWPVYESEIHGEPGAAVAEAVEDVARAVHRAVLSRVIADRDHHVQLNAVQTQDLRDWLTRPSGSLSDGTRLSLDAVAGGGVIVRTRPFVYQRPSRAHAEQQRRMNANRIPAEDGFLIPPTDPDDLPLSGNQPEPIVDGIRGHLPMTEQEVDDRRRFAEEELARPISREQIDRALGKAEQTDG